MSHHHRLVTSVHLEPPAAKKWVGEFAPRLLLEAIRLGLTADQIPAESGEALEDGTLLLYCDLPGGSRLSMSVPANEWRGELLH